MKEEGEVVAPILPPLPTGVQLTAQRNRRYLWHSGFVPYQISSNLSKLFLLSILELAATLQCQQAAKPISFILIKQFFESFESSCRI